MRPRLEVYIGDQIPESESTLAGLPARTRRRYLRALGALGSVVTLAVALIGLAHTKLGRPWLSWLGPALGCPVNLDAADPARVEQFRRQALARDLGRASAQSRPALAFELGRATRAEVTSWATERSRSCEELRQGSVLRCDELVIAPAEAKIEDVHFQFDAQARLVAVDLFRSGGSSAAASAHVQALTAALTASVGPPTLEHSLSDARALETQRFSRMSAKFSYSDYVAELSATNFGARGVRVRETYQWVPQAS